MEQTRKPRSRKKSKEAPEELGPEAIRCPFCRGALLDGTLAGSCEGCHTLHHVSCFADHRGCSTHGCGSTQAMTLRVGSSVPLDFNRLNCDQCSTPVEQDAMVARCACGRVLDINCYEALGACGLAGCIRPVRLLSHIEAAAAGARENLWVLFGLALVMVPGGILPLVITGDRKAAALLVLSLVGLGIFAVAVVRLWASRRLLGLRFASPRRSDGAADLKASEPPRA